VKPKRYRKRCEQQIGMCIQDTFAPLLRNCAQLAAAGENTDKRTNEILDKAHEFVIQLADIYDFVSPCFPEKYAIFRVIFTEYHQHLAFMLDCIGACAQQLANSDILKARLAGRLVSRRPRWAALCRAGGAGRDASRRTGHGLDQRIPGDARRPGPGGGGGALPAGRLAGDHSPHRQVHRAHARHAARMVCQHPGGGLGRHLQPPSQHASVPLLTERACGGPGGHQQRAQAGRRRPAVDAGRGGLFPDRERAGRGGGGGVVRGHAAAHWRGHPAHHARLPGALEPAALEAGGAPSCAPLTLLGRLPRRRSSATSRAT